MAMDDFLVHPKLTSDCELLGDLSLCRVLLMRDSRFPWLILVPRVPDLRDLHELVPNDRMSLMDEIEKASVAVKAIVDADKVNVAALGNQVPQLHVHVIGRREDDAAWPKPVWGVGHPVPYGANELHDTILTLALAMGIPGHE